LEIVELFAISIITFL